MYRIFICFLTFAVMIGDTNISVSTRAFAQSNEPISGIWLTQDGSSHVEFYDCADLRCGRIVWLKQPIDPTTGSKWLDRLNRTHALRKRRLIGLDIVFDLRQVGAGFMKGKLYNPLDGRTYSGSFKRKGNKLLMKGCILGGLICESERWTRVDSS